MSNKYVHTLIGSAKKFMVESAAIFNVELLKFIREPTELFSRAVQPVLWLVIFGQVFSRSRGIPTGNISYLAFMTPGILSQSVLFSAIFYGIAVIWERDLGIVHKMLVSPAYRSALVFGKALSSGLRGLAQSFIVYILALIMGVELNYAPLALCGVFVAVILGSSIFSTFSLIIACWVKTRERFMGIGQVLTMPLFFASNAIYPLEMMPNWLKVVARFNPLSYLVDLLRALMIRGGQTGFGLGFDFSILLAIFLILLVI
ncbi:MAG: ABC transporter permease, partial [Pseudobdellovibrionaceae bacterium]